MAQSVMQNLTDKVGLAGRVSIDSRATHEDEIGKPPYYETVRVLKQNDVPLSENRPRRFSGSLPEAAGRSLRRAAADSGLRPHGLTPGAGPPTK